MRITHHETIRSDPSSPTALGRDDRPPVPNPAYIRHALWVVCAVVGLARPDAAPAQQADWSHLAGNAARTSIAAHAPPVLTRVRWVANLSPGEEFVYAATPVAAQGRVFAAARVFVDFVHEANRLIAFRASDGQRIWSADTVADLLDSWSSPVIDVRNRTVAIAAAARLDAFHWGSGATAWSTSLPQAVVNASPLVTQDLVTGGAPSNRLVISTYSPFGTAALLAINVDPFDAAGNPYHPGELAWSVAVPQLSGATPAYADGIAVVVSRAGHMTAVHVATGSIVWTRPLGAFTFFGGAAIRDGHAYAASYNVSGGQNNSRLVKVRLSDGQLVWVTPSERTDSTPVVADDGRIYLAGGITGFGSAVKLQAFLDLGMSAAPLWDTWQATGGTLVLGGWTTQPLYAANRLLVGAPAGPGEPFGAYTDLFVLDVSRTPTDPHFVVSHHFGSGGSCAAERGAWFSIGAGGLFAFERVLGVDPAPAVAEVEHESAAPAGG